MEGLLVFELWGTVARFVAVPVSKQLRRRWLPALQQLLY
jgi:hypothetical protein